MSDYNEAATINWLIDSISAEKHFPAFGPQHRQVSSSSAYRVVSSPFPVASQIRQYVK
jgi:hypothetical protein